MTQMPNSPVFGEKLIARLAEEFLRDLRAEETSALHAMRASEEARNLWLLVTRGYFLGTYYADLGLSVQMGDPANTLESARRSVRLLNPVSYTHLDVYKRQSARLARAAGL